MAAAGSFQDCDHRQRKPEGTVLCFADDEEVGSSSAESGALPALVSCGLAAVVAYEEVPGS